MGDLAWVKKKISPKSGDRIFSLENKSAGHFFSEITHTPIKSRMVGP